MVPNVSLRRLVSLIALCVSLSACSLGSSDPPAPGATPTSAQAVREVPTPAPRTVWIEIQLEPGDGETVTLAAESDAIFIGTVRDMGEPFEGSFGRITWTPFQVEVEEVLKGDVEGEFTVAQMGGHHPNRNERLVVLVDTPESMEEIAPLEPGRSYLFATRTGGEDLPDQPGMYFAEPIFGHIPIEDDAQRHELVEEFTEVIERAMPSS